MHGDGNIIVACVYHSTLFLQVIAMLSPADDTDAQVYFTEAEWSCMVTIEKNRVTNMLRNYKYLLAQGKPTFIISCYSHPVRLPDLKGLKYWFCAREISAQSKYLRPVVSKILRNYK